MARLSLEHLGKLYDDGPHAVDDLNIDVEDGEFLVLVGPSGCGKTTALRMVAGLETISEGVVRIDDRVVNDVPPRDRDIAMVFQSYALYPHLTVGENIGFGLRLRKTPKQEIARRVEDVAKTLGLTEYLDRKPRNLSGGQRQRVAMGRAIVREPRAFLMDEPLSNLDAKLRVQMRSEVAQLQRDLAVTTIYVTHDQVEAMTLGHRVAVMREGVLQQVAPPQELYDEPVNVFVAGFIGSPAMNFATGSVERDDEGQTRLVLGAGSFAIPDEVLASRPDLRAWDGRDVVVGVRPEDLEDASVAREGDDAFTLGGTARIVEPLGSDIVVHVDLDPDGPEPFVPAERLSTDGIEALPGDVERPPVVARFNPRSGVRVGDRVRMVVDTARLHYFDPETGTAMADAG